MRRFFVTGGTVFCDAENRPSCHKERKAVLYMNIKSYDTIAAISSGMTASGIGIIRISGDKAISIADMIFKVLLCESWLLLRFLFAFHPLPCY